ncbi:hypothetical protein QOZ80_5AG0372400 [Eleusine coracana subsp. coracana]|nr:hypothetical protein QOZ80_5AG0372400 [Eleusine coracana subsp. coracana]
MPARSRQPHALENGSPAPSSLERMAADRTLSGDEKLVSQGGKFALGFFQPEEGAAGSWYVGIWYHNISVFTPVWVANSDRPVSDPTASRLTIAADGNLVLLDPSGSRAWSTNAISNAKSGNATVVAVLLDTGNLVLVPSRNASDQVLWQSFDHIGDTWLPGAKLRRDKLSAVIQQGMTSWRSRGDPAPGPYTLQPDPSGASQYVISMNGMREHYWASGYWNGEGFIGAWEVTGSGLYSEFLFATTDQEDYITYTLADNSTVYRFVMDVSGQVQALLWMEDLQAWNLIYSEPRTRCQVPRACGAFGVCSESTFDECLCVRGFRPRDAARWGLRDYAGGCVRNAELRCGKNGSNNDSDRFYLMLGVRLPDDGRAATGAPSSSGYCERACLDDCTCSAYAFNGSCILWHGDLQNLGNFYVGTDIGDLYIRLAATELPGCRSHNKWRAVEIAVGALAIVCLVVATSVLVVRINMSRRRAMKVQCLEGCVASFTYRELKSFTNNFSDKLGGGSFGSVFRGQLPDRTTTIAVKKLEGLWQGEKQFRAEVSTLGTIHHVNLICLLGFCSDSGDQNKLLVYEYMPNGSLDRHLFRAMLSWRVRYQIAVDVAKGLAYLHDKCRDCIIHCDIKPENILLDAGFVPKVADFGLAKLLRRDFSRVLTTMRGTIGYLAPEWISGEPITAKADVYSYGMMLFEIVSGRRNADHRKTESRTDPSSGVGGTDSDHAVADELFFPVLAARRLAQAEGDVMALLDPALGGDADAEEVSRVCKVACWCIQDEAEARPTMAEVVQVLEGVTKIDVPPVPSRSRFACFTGWTPRIRRRVNASRPPPVACYQRPPPFPDPAPMARNPGCTVFIGNLDEKVPERVLYEILIQVGRVVDLHIPRDKETSRSKGYAFAEYETEEIAQYAVKLFSGLVRLRNKTLRFAISGQDKPSSNVVNGRIAGYGVSPNHSYDSQSQAPSSGLPSRGLSNDTYDYSRRVFASALGDVSRRASREPITYPSY